VYSLSSVLPALSVSNKQAVIGLYHNVTCPQHKTSRDFSWGRYW